MSDAALKEMWLKHRGWSARSRDIKESLDRWRWWILALTIAGAVLATTAAQLKIYDPVNTWPQWITGASAVMMALVAFIARSMLDPDIEQRWIRARSLGEAAKAESFKYVTRAAPYDGSDPDTQMIDKVESLLTAGADVPTAEVAKDTALRGLPANPLPIEDYIRQRIDDQVDGYYRPKAAENERYASACAYITQIFSAAAAVLAAIATLKPASGLEVWVATIGTITGAVCAYALARRYQQLAASYRVTADRLALRLARWHIQNEKGKSAEADRALVSDIEGVIASENQSWMAEFLSSHKAAQKPAPDAPDSAKPPIPGKSETPAKPV